VKFSVETHLQRTFRSFTRQRSSAAKLLAAVATSSTPAPVELQVGYLQLVWADYSAKYICWTCEVALLCTKGSPRSYFKITTEWADDIRLADHITYM